MKLDRPCLSIAPTLVAALILAGGAPLPECAIVTVGYLKARPEDCRTAIIDPRRPSNDQERKIRIKGAVREDWGKISQRAPGYDPEQTVVLSCA